MGYKMKGPTFFGKSPLKQKPGSKKIIGEDTLEGKTDKKGNIQRDIVPGPFVDVPDKSVLVTTPDQDKKMPKTMPKHWDVKTNEYVDTGEDYIEQMHPMEIQQDSISGGITYYSIPKKKKKK